MRRILRKNRSKIAMTLVELIVTMALTSFFAACCAALILPVERIYKHMTDLSRAQLLADTCIDTLRKECAKTYIETPDDVWIFKDESFDGTTNRLGAASSTSGEGTVLVLRKNITYWETIASNSNYSMQRKLYDGVLAAEGAEAQTASVTSRSVYRMFDPEPGPDTKAGFVHFGYYEKIGIDEYEYYDFTNPFTSATYRDLKVDLKFNGIHKTSEDLPAYVNCTIKVTKNGAAVYERNTILCFASPVKR